LLLRNYNYILKIEYKIKVIIGNVVLWLFCKVLIFAVLGHYVKAPNMGWQRDLQNA